MGHRTRRPHDPFGTDPPDPFRTDPPFDPTVPDDPPEAPTRPVLTESPLVTPPPVPASADPLAEADRRVAERDLNAVVERIHGASLDQLPGLLHFGGRVVAVGPWAKGGAEDAFPLVLRLAQAASERAASLGGTLAARDARALVEGGFCEGVASVEAPPEPEPVEEPGAELRTDLGNARRLVRLHGRNLRYCPSLGWLWWDGRRWARDCTGAAMRKMKATVRTIFNEAKQAKTSEEAEALGKWAARSQGAGRLVAALSLAETEEEIVVAPDRLDADPWLFCVENGTLDLRTGELRPHSRGDLITKIAPVPYTPSATAPRWERFLEEVQPDPEIRALLRRVVGASLCGRRHEHVLLVFWGTGGNGKSVFTLIWFLILGDYARKARVETFLDRDNKGPSNDLAALAGARLVLAAEPEAGARLAESFVKDVTGGDPVTARFLYAEFFTFTPAFVPVLVTNHRPEISGTDFGIWRRIQLVPWSVRISGTAAEDPKLAETLRKEIPGILSWAVRGCLEWQRDGLHPPGAVAAATEDYREAEDVLGPFFVDRCVLGDAFSVTSCALWTAYQRWADATKEKLLSRRAFGDRLLDRGLRPIRTGKGRTRGWEGIGLADGADASEPVFRNSSREVASRELPEADASGVRHASAAPPANRPDLPGDDGFTADVSPEDRGAPSDLVDLPPPREAHP